MSIDHRLREGLDRAMSTIDIDVDQHLDRARRVGRRRAVVRRTLTVVAVAAAIVVAALAAPAVLDAIRSQRHQPATTPSPLAITGSYVSTITDQEATSAGDPRAAGSWVLRIRGDGILELASLKHADLGGGSSQYQLTGEEILTTALSSPTCTGVGRYAWSRRSDTLSLVAVSDPCALRVAVFSSHPWNVG
jgi:hypothetical protein